MDAATSRSRITASSATCARPRWWAWTARSTGSACRTSIRPASSPPSSTTDKGGRFRIAPAGDGLPPQAVLLAGHQRPGHALPARRRRGRGRGLHAGRRQRRGAGRADPQGAGGPRPGGLSIWSAAPPSTTPAPPTRCHLDEHGARFDGPGLSLGLAAPVPLRPDGAGRGRRLHARRRARRPRSSCAASHPDDEPGRCPGRGEAEELFRDTVAYWRRWLSRCTYSGRWREMVQRSALTLKLLSFEPTGAIVAAPTCSLPEAIGGLRNWDYRYTWIRDAAFTLYACLRIGFTEEAARFRDWLKDRWQDADGTGTGPLQLMYGIDGRADLTGGDARPPGGLPRLAAGADRQRRPPAAAAGHLRRADGRGLPPQQVRRARSATTAGCACGELVDWVCDNWGREDEGIWEVRGGRRHFVYSKFMCWVALDRGLRLADKRSFPADRAALAEGPRRDLRGGDGQGLGPAPRGRSCRPTAPTPWTPRAC